MSFWAKKLTGPCLNLLEKFLVWGSFRNGRHFEMQTFSPVTSFLMHQASSIPALPLSRFVSFLSFYNQRPNLVLKENSKYTCQLFLTQRRDIFKLGVPEFSRTTRLYPKISEDTRRFSKTFRIILKLSRK